MKSLIRRLFGHTEPSPDDIGPDVRGGPSPASAAKTMVPGNWELLSDLLRDTYVPYGSSTAEPVWRGELTVEPGTRIYRGCRAASPEAAIAQFDEPRFWTDDPDSARHYAKWTGVPELEELPGYVLSAEIVVAARLANMALFPLVEAINSAPHRFGLAAAPSPQNIQRLYGTAIARTFTGKEYAGIRDRSELLMSNHTIYRVDSVDRLC